MAPKRAVTLLFQSTKKTFELDCTESLNIQRTAEVTRFPMEGGGNVSDHRDRQPLTIQLAGQMSDVHPFRTNPEADPFLPVAYDPEATGAHTQLEQALIAADKNNELITIQAGRRGTYADLLLQDFPTIHETSQGSAFFFSLAFVQLEIAETKTTDLVTDARSRKKDLTFRIAQTEGDKKALATFKDKAIGGGLKEVKTATEFQRWSPPQGRGQVTPQAIGGPLSDCLDNVINIPGAPAGWAR